MGVSQMGVWRNGFLLHLYYAFLQLYYAILTLCSVKNFSIGTFLSQDFVDDPESNDAVDVSIVRVLEQMGCIFEKVCIQTVVDL